MSKVRTILLLTLRERLAVQRLAHERGLAFAAAMRELVDAYLRREQGKRVRQPY